MPLFPNPDLEKRIYELANLPPPVDMEAPAMMAPTRLQEPLGTSPNTPVDEQHDEAGMQHAEPVIDKPEDTPQTPQEKALIEHLTQQAKARAYASKQPPLTKVFA